MKNRYTRAFMLLVALSIGVAINDVTLIANGLTDLFALTTAEGV